MPNDIDDIISLKGWFETIKLLISHLKIMGQSVYKHIKDGIKCYQIRMEYVYENYNMLSNRDNFEIIMSNGLEGNK